MTAATTIIRCPNCSRKNRVPVAGKGWPRCGSCHEALPWIVDALDDTFAEIAEKADVPVIVDMWATWCGPCHLVSPVLEMLAAERAGDVKLVKVDIDRAPRLSSRFMVQAVPTLLIMHRGKLIARQAGAAPAHVLRRWFDDVMQKDAQDEEKASAGAERRRGS